MGPPIQVYAALIDTVKLALNGEWESVTLTNGFSMRAVMAGAQTENDGQEVSTRIGDLNGSGIGLAMDEQERRNDGRLIGMHGWTVIEAGTGSTAGGRKVQSFFADIGVVLKAVSYPESTTHRYPTIVADIDSIFDADPVFLRFDDAARSAIKLKIAEEASAEAEPSHSPETVRIFVGEYWKECGGEHTLATATPIGSTPLWAGHRRWRSLMHQNKEPSDETLYESLKKLQADVDD